MPNELKLLWTSEGGVLFKGRGIIEAWRGEMEKKGWICITEPDRWEECDLVFFGSDSQLFEGPLGKKPTILYFWGWDPGKLLGDFKPIAVKQLSMMAQCTRILTPSLVTSYQVADFGLPSSVCLPGVDTEVLNLAEYGERKQQVMFLSRLVPHKHLDALIVALSMIDPPPELLAVGPGDVKPYRELADRYDVPVIFTELSDQEKANQLRQSAMLVHPSDYEGFGLPPLEALYWGTPVVAFDIPQLRWLLQEDAYYFSTVEGLAQTILQILGGPAEAMLRASKGRDRIRKSLTLELACDRLWAHIHQVIKEHLGMELRRNPDAWAEIYNDEHRRNWAYSLDRFDPTWERHWRAQAYIDLLKDCGAKNILDVGCGAVYPTIFARAGFEVHAVDISEECIDQVIKIAQKWGVESKIWAHVASAERLPWTEPQFDAVIQGELWEHVLNVEKIISEGLRLLKPGGYLIATTPIGEHHYDPMHIRVFDDDSIRELVTKFWEVARLDRIEKIAESGTDPSCYLVVLEKL